MRLTVAYFFKTTFIAPPATKKIKLATCLALTPQQSKLMQDMGVKGACCTSLRLIVICTVMTNTFVVNKYHVYLILPNCFRCMVSWRLVEVDQVCK
jgi:hypothetical protein